MASLSECLELDLKEKGSDFGDKRWGESHRQKGQHTQRARVRKELGEHKDLKGP